MRSLPEPAKMSDDEKPGAATGAFSRREGRAAGCLGLDALRRQRHAAADGWPSLYYLEPALHPGKLIGVLSLAFPRRNPGHGRDVGDRVLARQIAAIGELPLHHAVEALAFVGETVDRVGDFLGRKKPKMMGRCRRGTEPA